MLLFVFLTTAELLFTAATLVVTVSVDIAVPVSNSCITAFLYQEWRKDTCKKCNGVFSHSGDIHAIYYVFYFGTSNWVLPLGRRKAKCFYLAQWIWSVPIWDKRSEVLATTSSKAKLTYSVRIVVLFLVTSEAMCRWGGGNFKGTQ